MSKVLPPHISDWLSRVTIPDMYPRLDDPFQPSYGVPPSTVPAASLQSPPMDGNAVLSAQLTTPGTRPIVYQRMLNFAFTVTTTPTAILNQRINVDEILVDNLSTAANSVFVGFGSQVSTASGIEVRAGIPLVLSAQNVREQWELQRSLEYIAALMAIDRGMDPLPQFRSVRVVFDPSQYFLVASASTNITISLFYVPEQQ